MKLIICLFALISMTMAEDTDIENLFKEANEKFTAKMFTEVVKQHPNENVVLSAFSVLTPLAQLSLASTGASHDELLKAIGLPNDNVTKEVFSQLTTKVRSIKGIELKMANKVYIPVGYELNEKFASLSKDVFDSEVQNVDFAKSTEAAKLMNTWVEDHTNHRIKDLVSADSLGSDTRAVLVNALYFKGNWKEKFNKDDTRDNEFHVSKDKTIMVPFMFKEDYFSFGYSDELKAKLLELPYEGEEASFLVVLPDEIDGLPALQEKLKDPSVLDNAVKNMVRQEVTVYLPKFKIETTTDLKTALQSMDVKKIFSSEAKLDNLLKNTKDLYVSAAKQKAFIEVNEDGAEAAAANEFIIMENRAGHTENARFRADRPFYYELKYNNISLFNGLIQQPSSLL